MRLFLSVAIGALATSALFAQIPAPSENSNPPEAAPSPDTSQLTDVLSYDKRGRLMAVPVSITGQGPFSFLVDSGAERTIISAELAKKLALQRGNDVRVLSMTDTRTFSTARIPQLQFSRKRVSDIHAPALPASDIGAAGSLGVDSLRRQRVEFNFAKQTMTVTPARAEEAQWTQDAIVITAKTLYGRLVLTDVYIEGLKVLAVIDTGSDLSIGNRALQDKLARKNRLPPTTPMRVWSVTGRPLDVDYAQLGRLTVGNLVISNMPVGFADAHLFHRLKLEDRPVVMLGMDTLRLFTKISVDFARKEVRFQLPEGRSSGRMAMTGFPHAAAK
jgi:hypothetical protein